MRMLRRRPRGISAARRPEAPVRSAGRSRDTIVVSPRRLSKRHEIPKRPGCGKRGSVQSSSVPGSLSRTGFEPCPLTAPIWPEIHTVTPSALGCEECLKIGDLGPSAHLPYLRPCRLLRRLPPTSMRPNISTRPGIRSSKAMTRRKAGAGAMWMRSMFDLSDRMTPHNGPIPRFV